MGLLDSPVETPGQNVPQKSVRFLCGLVQEVFDAWFIWLLGLCMWDFGPLSRVHPLLLKQAASTNPGDDQHLLDIL